MKFTQSPNDWYCFTIHRNMEKTFYKHLLTYMVFVLRYNITGVRCIITIDEISKMVNNFNYLTIFEN